MKIVGLLSWYDESPSWLAAAVASFAPVIDELVAVDGAYGLYPQSKPTSERTQAETIMSTCEALGVGCTIHRPAERWLGNEVEKRRFMFELAAPLVETGVDWFFVFDGDCVLTTFPADLKETLSSTELHAAEVTLWERRDHIGDTPTVARQITLPNEGHQSLRCLYRSLDGMRVVGAHFHYGGFVDGEWIWAWAPQRMAPTPALALPFVQVEHRSIWRDAYRRQQAQDYYRRRDELKIETLYSVDQDGNSLIDVS